MAHIRISSHNINGQVMRYFLDTEFNGFGGELISIALVPEFGDHEYYAVLPLPETLHPWVERHVVPYLHMVPENMNNHVDAVAAAHEVAAYLVADRDPIIIADWPEDIALFCRLLMPGPGLLAESGSLKFEFHHNPGFSTARNSKIPHNALHDARALRDFILSSND